MLGPDSLGSLVIAAGRGSTSGAGESAFDPPSALTITTTTRTDIITTAPIPESTTTEVLLGPMPFSSSDEDANISSNPSTSAFLPVESAASLDSFFCFCRGNLSEMNDFFGSGEASLCGSSAAKMTGAETASLERVGVAFSFSLAVSNKFSGIGVFLLAANVGRSSRSSFTLTSPDFGETSTPLKNSLDWVSVSSRDSTKAFSPLPSVKSASKLSSEEMSVSVDPIDSAPSSSANSSSSWN